ncbi:MAG TPA: TonB-dependent receptor [Rhizomicrobium sp.]|jgi:outer membrane receptor protein involved in Fe transport
MSIRNVVIPSLLAGSAVFCFASGAALAQTAVSESSPVEVVVVTAEKRSEPLKDTPMAVTAINATALQDMGAVSFRDLTASVPGLQIAGGLGSGYISLRGITTGNDGDSTVGLQIDGVPIGPTAFGAAAGAYMPELDPSVLARVEVLRGPQGTLYGSSTLGGIINYVTQRPDISGLMGSAYAEGTSTKNGGVGGMLRGMFNAPISDDTAAVQLSAFYGDTDGFIDNTAFGRNDINDRRNYGGRAAFLFQLAPKLTVQLADLYAKLSSVQDLVTYNPVTQRPAFGDLVNNDAVAPVYDSKFNVTSANLDYDWGWSTASAIVSYQTLSTTNVADFSDATLGQLAEFVLPLAGGVTLPTPGNPAVSVLLDNHKFTSELRLTSSDVGNLTWIIGAFYNDETSTNIQRLASFDGDNAPNPSPLNDLVTYDLITHYRELAGFGNLTYAISDKFDITGGLRIQDITQDYRQLYGGADADALNAIFVGAGLAATPADSGLSRAQDSVVTYLANARYHFTPDSMIYVRFATGFRPGGPNIIVPGLPKTFDPDTTRDYEIGWKTSFYDGHGFLDLSLYHIDWNNIQIITFSNGINGLTNGGQAESQGVEASVNIEPIDGLTLSGSLAFSDAKLTQNLPGFLGNDGDPLPMNPRWSGSLSAEYAWQVANGWGAFANASGNYAGERNIGFASSLIYKQYTLPDYAVLNLRAGVKHDDWEMAAFVRNLTDERAQLGASTLSDTMVAVARPRTVGISLSVQY